jgi:hypothetical protein
MPNNQQEEFWSHFDRQFKGLELHSVEVSRKDARAEIDRGVRIGAVGRNEIVPKIGVWKPIGAIKPMDLFGTYVEKR